MQKNTPSLSSTAQCWVLLLSLMLSGCDRLRSVDAIASRGEAQYEKGNYRAALADFKMALERDGHSLKARAGLARVSYQLADFETAQAAVDAALAQGSVDADLPRLKYKSLLARQQYQAVHTLLASERHLSDVERLLYAGRADAGSGQHEAAAEKFKQALSLQPENVEVLIAKARLAGEQNDVVAALADVDAALVRSTENAEAWMLKGALLVAKSDMAGAQAALEKAEKLGKTQLNWNEQTRLYAILVDLSLRQSNQESAAHWLNGLNLRAPQGAVTFYMKARLALLQDNTNEALAQLQKVNPKDNYLPARLLLANLLLTKTSYGQAEEQINKLRRDYPENIEVRKLQAQLYLATQRAVEAAKVLPEAAPGGVPDVQADWLRGQALLAAGSRDAGVALLEKSVNGNPGDVGRTLQLARTYIATGEAGKALALLNSLPADSGPQWQGLIVVASVMGKPLSEARRDLDALLTRHAKDSTMHSAAASALMQLGDTVRAKELFGKAIELDSGNLDARTGLAVLLARNGQFAEAETQLREVLNRDGKRMQSRMVLANIALAKGDKNQAVKELELAAGMDATAVDPRLQLAQMAFVDNDASRGRGLLDQAVAASSSSPAVIEMAGDTLFQAKQYEDALTRYEQAISAGRLAARLSAARVYLALDRQSEARQKLELAVGVPETQVQAAAMLAALDARAGQLDRALKRIDQLPKAQLPGGLYDELRGDVYAQAKQFEQAAKAYDSATKQAATQRLAVKGFQSRVQGKLPNTLAPLVAWLARQPNDVLALRLLAQQSLLARDNGSAARYFERLLAALPKRDPLVLNDLAWTYQLLGDKRAEATAHEAYQAAPGSAEIADTYGWILLQANKVSEALPILEKAVAGKKEDLEIQYHLAAAQARSGQKDTARSTLQQALAGKQPFVSRPEAENLLTSLAK